MLKIKENERMDQRESGNQRELLGAIKQLSKYANWKHRPASLLCNAIDGRLPSKNRIGQPMMNLIDNIQKWCGGATNARNMTTERLRLLRAMANFSLS